MPSVSLRRHSRSCPKVWDPASIDVAFDAVRRDDADPSRLSFGRVECPFRDPHDLVRERVHRRRRLRGSATNRHALRAHQAPFKGIGAGLRLDPLEALLILRLQAGWQTIVLASPPPRCRGRSGEHGSQPSPAFASRSEREGRREVCGGRALTVECAAMVGIPEECVADAPVEGAAVGANRNGQELVARSSETQVGDGGSVERDRDMLVFLRRSSLGRKRESRQERQMA